MGPKEQAAQFQSVLGMVFIAVVIVKVYGVVMCGFEQAGLNDFMTDPLNLWEVVSECWACGGGGCFKY